MAMTDQRPAQEAEKRLIQQCISWGYILLKICRKIDGNSGWPGLVIAAIQAIYKLGTAPVSLDVAKNRIYSAPLVSVLSDLR
jgi:hypothetical protein